MKEQFLRKEDDDGRNGDSSFRLLSNAVSTADVTCVKVREKKEYGRNKKKSAIMYQLLKLKC
jgi:hypothetical protein